MLVAAQEDTVGHACCLYNCRSLLLTNTYYVVLYALLSSLLSDVLPGCLQRNEVLETS
jgi:hypothetical protein